MNRISIALLSTLAGLAINCLPGSAVAGTVGYTWSCAGNPVQYISDAGHTAVPVSTYTASTLAPLDGLVVGNCSNQFVTNAAINAKVAKGMTLIVHDRHYTGPSILPGIASLNPGSFAGYDVNLPTASPIITGPGGVLTNASLDTPPPFCFPVPFPPYQFCFSIGPPSVYGSIAASSLPANSTVLATTGSTSQVVAFAYPYGKGRVVYSTVAPDNIYFNPATTTYLVNLIDWSVPHFTSCAAEGFGGSKLALCKQVCEMNYSGTRLSALIRAWTGLYHEDPPCAR